MKKALLIIIQILFAFSAFAFINADEKGPDSSEVIKLNKQGFDMRLTDPNQTVAVAGKALIAARKINYKKGVAESYRVMGIGNYYLDQPLKAIDNYLTALSYFQDINDLKSQASVYNNIGNLYRDNDYDRSLEFFEKSLAIAKKLADQQLIARLYLNIGAAYQHKNSLYQALNYYNKCDVMFTAQKDTVNLVQCMQNKGVIYISLRQLDTAERLLLIANKRAKQLDLNKPIASIDISLADIYITENKFEQAEKIIAEGTTYAKMVNSKKNQADFVYTSYQLQLKRKNYEGALHYLQGIYTTDSTVWKQNTSTQITIIRERVTQQAREKENELLIQRQENDRIKFWGVAIVAGLLLILVGVLINNVKRKTKTNTQLTNLNAEVSRQKDNLDRINHHLEEIIDERTKDLQVKNKKLSEYSSYLSHQIRGPIATLKGLLNLEKEGLVDGSECIKMMNKTVSEIDDKIIEMSDMLHDPGRAGF